MDCDLIGSLLTVMRVETDSHHLHLFDISLASEHFSLLGMIAINPNDGQPIFTSIVS
jgi:hypothetical protein